MELIKYNSFEEKKFKVKKFKTSIQKDRQIGKLKLNGQSASCLISLENYFQHGVFIYDTVSDGEEKCKKNRISGIAIISHLISP